MVIPAIVVPIFAISLIESLFILPRPSRPSEEGSGRGILGHGGLPPERVRQGPAALRRPRLLARPDPGHAGPLPDGGRGHRPAHPHHRRHRRRPGGLLLHASGGRRLVHGEAHPSLRDPRGPHPHRAASHPRRGPGLHRRARRPRGSTGHLHAHRKPRGGLRPHRGSRGLGRRRTRGLRAGLFSSRATNAPSRWRPSPRSGARRWARVPGIESLTYSFDIGPGRGRRHRRRTQPRPARGPRDGGGRARREHALLRRRGRTSTTASPSANPS